MSRLNEVRMPVSARIPFGASGHTLKLEVVATDYQEVSGGVQVKFFMPDSKSR